MICFLRINFELEQQMQMATKNMKIKSQLLPKKKAAYVIETCCNNLNGHIMRSVCLSVCLYAIYGLFNDVVNMDDYIVYNDRTIN